jgi:uncharacterized protein YndB with AHSA1/START domain
MTDDRFVYVTYIRATPEKVWEALISPEFTPLYWFGIVHDSDWRPGSAWKMIRPNGEVTESGEVLEVEKPKRLVLKWRNEFMPELRAEGYSRCTIEIEPAGEGAVKLSVLHEIDKPGSKLIGGVSAGWPRILSNLKSLLETGQIVSPTSEMRKSA